MRYADRLKSAKLPLAILALISVFSLTFIVRTDMVFSVLNYSVVSPLLFFAVYAVLKAAMKCFNGRLLATAFPLGLLFALAMVSGAMMYQYNSALLWQAKTWAGIVSALPLTVSAAMLLIERLPNAIWNASGLNDRKEHLSPRAAFALAWALIFLAWLPGLIASYPGVYGYDCIYQLQYYLSGALETHHPVIHTALLGFCVVTVGDWLGSREAGMCVYAVVQMLAFSAAFASVLAWLRRRGIPAVWRLVLWLLAMFLPTNAILSFSGTKDVLFSAMIVWQAMLCIDAAEEPERLKRPAFLVRFLLTAFLLMIFRNQGVYVFGFMMLSGLLVMRGARKPMLALLAAGLILFAGFQGPVSAWMGAKRIDTAKEALSLPCVQLARARWENADRLSFEDKAAIEAYLPNWNDYDSTSWGISDPIKATFNTALFRQDSAAFFRLWARVGAQCPESYINAFLRLTLGLWYVDMPYPDAAAHHPYLEYYNTDKDGDWLLLKRTTPACLQWLADLYAQVAYNSSYQKIPVLSLVMSAGMATWVLLGFIGWALYKRRWRMLFPAGLLLGLWVTLLLSPVVLLRYAYPLMMCEPLLLAAMAGEARKDRNDRQ